MQHDKCVADGSMHSEGPSGGFALFGASWKAKQPKTTGAGRWTGVLLRGLSGPHSSGEAK